MTGPGGTSTKRDQRRDTRRAQFQQRQLERQRERVRRIRNQRIRLASFIGVGVLLLAIIVVAVVSHTGGSAVNSSPVAMKLASGGHPANGQAVDGMTCQQEMVTVHYHAYFEMYADGHPVTLPAGAGIVSPQGSGVPALASNGNTACLYQLHVHTDDNIIHIESPANTPYTLGMFFDVLGQPLSTTQVAGYKSDATHKLTYETFDGNGNLTKVTDDPRAITFSPHQTIAILYNSPNVTPKAYTDWTPGE